jgi:calcineurin-like phosphoesterase family protein
MKIILKPEQQLFFTSDTHYSHKNICRATTEWKDADDKTRDFKSLNHMNDTIVNNINKRVGEDDILFHLGDWSFGGFEKIQELRDRIICKNIYIITGNHDHFLRDNKDEVQKYFTKIFPPYLELEVIKQAVIKNTPNKKYNFVLSHYPIVSWNGMNKGYMHIHGHTHLPNNLKLMPGRGIDCGLDGNLNFCPYVLEEIVKLIGERPIKSMFEFDHHVSEVR